MKKFIFIIFITSICCDDDSYQNYDSTVRKEFEPLNYDYPLPSRKYEIDSFEFSTLDLGIKNLD